MNYGTNNQIVPNVTRSGPVTNFIGASVSLGGIFLSFLILLVITFLLIGNYKTKDYQPVEVTFVSMGIDDFADSEISYQVNGVNYNAKIVVDGDYKVGDKTTFYCDFLHPENIIEYQSSFNSILPVFIVFLLIFVAFIFSFRRKINNVLYFINPSKYKYDYTDEIREYNSFTNR